ncbi:hypothetical protein D9M71_640660 [compost metagenome]
MTEHVGQHVLGHHLAEDAHGAGQAVVALQAVGQQRRDAGPGRLQPLGLMPLAQQRCQQVWLAQPHIAIGGQAGQFRRVATGEDVQVRCRLAQQASVEGMVLFGDQNAHVRYNLGRNFEGRQAIRRGGITSGRRAQTGSLRRSSSSGRCSMYSSSSGGICR